MMNIELIKKSMRRADKAHREHMRFQRYHSIVSNLNGFTFQVIRHDCVGDLLGKSDVFEVDSLLWAQRVFDQYIKSNAGIASLKVYLNGVKKPFRTVKFSGNENCTVNYTKRVQLID